MAENERAVRLDPHLSELPKGIPHAEHIAGRFGPPIVQQTQVRRIDDDDFKLPLTDDVDQGLQVIRSAQHRQIEAPVR